MAASPPRKLTEDELDDIVSVLPRVMAAATEVADKVSEQIKKKLKDGLTDLEICPEGIPLLKKEIVRQFNKSVINPGTTVGITAAEAIGQPITQLALDSFHHSGAAASVSMGIDAIRELFNISTNRKHENSTIHFRNKNLSFEEVLDLRRSIVGVSVRDLLKSTDLLEQDPDDITKPLEERWWYSPYFTIMGKTPPSSRHYLHMRFDVNKLYAYNITPNDIVRALEKKNERCIKCIASPTYLGIVDVYPDERQLKACIKDRYEGDKSIDFDGITSENESIIFLQNVLEKNLGSIIVQGAAGITQIFPSKARTWSIIRLEEPAFKAEVRDAELNISRKKGVSKKKLEEVNEVLERTWVLWLDLIRMKITGIPLEKLITLLNKSRINVTHVPYDFEHPEPYKNYKDEDIEFSQFNDQVIIVLPDDVKKGNRPGDYINDLIKAAEEEMNKKEEEERKAGTPYPKRIPSDIFRAGWYYYATSNGSNLKELLGNPNVDQRRTICNNYHQIRKTLGIEATRNFLIREMYIIIEENRSYVNPRYIQLMVDFMTNQGILIPITSRGVARQNIGAFAKASFEHAMDAFVDAAAFGKEEKVRSTSTSIIVGKRAIIGTGSFDLQLNKELLEGAEQEEQFRKQKEFEAQLQEKSLKASSNLVLESDLFQFGEEPDIQEEDAYNVPEGPVRPNLPQAPLRLGPAISLVPPGRTPSLSQKFREVPARHTPIPEGMPPKGPIPSVVPSMTPPPFVSTILSSTDSRRSASILPPSLSGAVNINRLLGTLKRTAPSRNIGEVDIDLSSIGEV